MNRWSRQETTVRLSQARAIDEDKRLTSLPTAGRTEQRVADIASERGTVNSPRRS